VAAQGTGHYQSDHRINNIHDPAYARLLRSLILPLKDAEYVEAAKASGTNTWKIIFGHLLPNAMGPLIVNSTLAVGKTIVSAAGMSFLGLGISPPNPDWGAMLSEGKEYIRYAPHLCFIPEWRSCWLCFP
jgi:peptide/nickel transport system permease protein